MSGFTASMISRFKPGCPVIGCTVKRLVWRQLNLQWGVMPLLIQEENTAEDLFHAAIDAAMEAGYIVKEIMLLSPQECLWVFPEKLTSSAWLRYKMA